MIITKTEKLQELCEKLRKKSFFALDTEFVREKTYYPQLCLIQVASKGIEAIIDPLSPELDLKPFLVLLEDKTVKKVLHSSRQDIEIFFHLTGKIPQNIYDTQIAAMVCGFGESIAYEKLVNHYCNVELDKSHRLTDWTSRPLSDEQVSYALSDVIYLVDIYEKITQEIKNTKREGWVEEEMKTISDKDIYISDPEEVWQKIRPKPQEKKKREILKTLAKWREHRAMEFNIPRGHVVPDNVLVNIAKHYDQKDSRTIKGTRYKKEIKEVLQNVSKLEETEAPYYEPESKNLFSLLKILLRLKCEENNIAPKIVASKEDIIRLINGEQELAILSGWRYDIFGRDALRLINGEVMIGNVDGEISIIDKI